MEALEKNWGWLLALGILMIVLGVFAIAAPVVATLAVELMLGWILVIAGLAQVAQAFGARRWRGFLLHLLGGVAYLLVGVLMLFYPFEGALALTMLLAAFLVVQGLFQAALAWQIRPATNWGWALASGIASLVLGILIWVQWPSSALWVIGVLVGIHLLFSGWAFAMLALAVRRHAGQPPLDGVGQRA